MAYCFLRIPTEGICTWILAGQGNFHKGWTQQVSQLQTMSDEHNRSLGIVHLIWYSSTLLHLMCNHYKYQLLATYLSHKTVSVIRYWIKPDKLLYKLKKVKHDMISFTNNNMHINKGPTKFCIQQLKSMGYPVTTHER